MNPDITIELRFKTNAEGGRAGPVVGKHFGCAMFISGEAFDCRLLTEGGTLELGQTYEVPVKFLNADLALPKLMPGKEISLWEGKEIATGKVLRFGA
jgi:hypothetical protein